MRKSNWITFPQGSGMEIILKNMLETTTDWHKILRFWQHFKKTPPRNEQLTAWNPNMLQDFRNPETHLTKSMVPWENVYRASPFKYTASFWVSKEQKIRGGMPSHKFVKIKRCQYFISECSQSYPVRLGVKRHPFNPLQNHDCKREPWSKREWIFQKDL